MKRTVARYDVVVAGLEGAVLVKIR